MRSDRQLPSRAQGDATDDAKRDAAPRISGDCFGPHELLPHFEPDEVERRVLAGIEAMNNKRVYRMKKRGRG